MVLLDSLKHGPPLTCSCCVMFKKKSVVIFKYSFIYQLFFFEGEFTLRLDCQAGRRLYLIVSHGVTPLISPVMFKPVQVYLHLSCEPRRLLE